MPCRSHLDLQFTLQCSSSLFWRRTLFEYILQYMGSKIYQALQYPLTKTRLVNQQEALVAELAAERLVADHLRNEVPSSLIIIIAT